ncbi:hypothetical protein HOLleu_37369 [Holothuria leucospilota]|uniref:Uncharacterized protein n=1 Tax=Holothuria leucospilota TaxID=206669 RepID=A0A9Q0YJC2_HOLLE|nr:hypothetical protein HOLleu_37369 [Holothuria leucospilota]
MGLLQPQNNTLAQQPQTTPKSHPSTNRPTKATAPEGNTTCPKATTRPRTTPRPKATQSSMAILRPTATTLIKHWAHTGAPCPSVPRRQLWQRVTSLLPRLNKLHNRMQFKVLMNK